MNAMLKQIPVVAAIIVAADRIICDRGPIKKRTRLVAQKSPQNGHILTARSTEAERKTIPNTKALDTRMPKASAIRFFKVGTDKHAMQVAKIIVL